MEETTRVLTEASISGKIGHLRGLKESVLVPPQPTEDDLDLDREIEYAFDTDEPMLGRPPAGDVE